MSFLATGTLKKDIFSKCKKCQKILKQMLNVITQRTLYFLYRDTVVLHSTGAVSVKACDPDGAVTLLLLTHCLCMRYETGLRHGQKRSSFFSSTFYLWESASFFRLIQ